MSNYQCNLCSHLYVTEQGDPLRGIAAGTTFEELPEEWVCPVCGVGKGSFHEVLESCEPAQINIL